MNKGEVKSTAKIAHCTTSIASFLSLVFIVLTLCVLGVVQLNHCLLCLNTQIYANSTKIVLVLFNKV